MGCDRILGSDPYWGESLKSASRPMVLVVCMKQEVGALKESASDLGHQFVEACEEHALNGASTVFVTGPKDFWEEFYRDGAPALLVTTGHLSKAFGGAVDVLEEIELLGDEKYIPVELVNGHHVPVH